MNTKEKLPASILVRRKNCVNIDDDSANENVDVPLNKIQLEEEEGSGSDETTFKTIAVLEDNNIDVFESVDRATVFQKMMKAVEGKNRQAI